MKCKITCLFTNCCLCDFESHIDVKNFRYNVTQKTKTKPKPNYLVGNYCVVETESSDCLWNSRGFDPSILRHRKSKGLR